MCAFILDSRQFNAVCGKTVGYAGPRGYGFKDFQLYQDKSEIGFLETRIGPNSSLIGKKVKDLNLTFDFIVAKIERNGKTIVPRGHVTIKENDLIVIGGAVHFDKTGHELTEFTISKGHKWQNKYIKDLGLPHNHLIIMIQREGNEIIVPVGDTLLLEGDKIIMIKAEHPLEFPLANEMAT